MADMDPEMHAAFERAINTPMGYLEGAPEAVLKRLDEAGIAARDNDEEDYSLTDKGWELGALADPVSASGIKYRVANTARWEIPIELVDPVPDTWAPGFPMVRPTSVTLSLTPNRAGVWCVSSAAVWGPKVKDGKVTTTREYSALFSDLMNDVGEAPEWLREICQDWADRANGVVVPAPKEDFDELLEQSSLGAPRVKAETEEIPEAAQEKMRAAVKKSPQRDAFESALRVLLIRENLDGAQWAIQQIREEAAGAGGTLGPVLASLASSLEKGLDKRAVELSLGRD